MVRDFNEKYLYIYISLFLVTFVNTDNLQTRCDEAIKHESVLTGSMDDAKRFTPVCL